MIRSERETAEETNPVELAAVRLVMLQPGIGYDNAVKAIEGLTEEQLGRFNEGLVQEARSTLKGRH